MIGKGAGGRTTPLQADLVDSLEKCGQVDPSPYISEEHREAMTDPDVLVPVLPDSPSAAKFTSGARSEYIKFIRAQCKSNKVVWQDILVFLPPFSVTKQDTRGQREVWDGSDFTAAAKTTAPRPPLLSGPTDLNVLECSDDQPLRMSVRDG